MKDLKPLIEDVNNEANPHAMAWRLALSLLQRDLSRRLGAFNRCLRSLDSAPNQALRLLSDMRRMELQATV